MLWVSNKSQETSNGYFWSIVTDQDGTHRLCGICGVTGESHREGFGGSCVTSFMFYEIMLSCPEALGWFCALTPSKRHSALNPIRLQIQQTPIALWIAWTENPTEIIDRVSTARRVEDELEVYGWPLQCKMSTWGLCWCVYLLAGGNGWNIGASVSIIEIIKSLNWIVTGCIGCKGQLYQ